MQIVILGATGTLGRETLKQIVGSWDFDQIICYSRDELKQQELKKLYPDLTYVIGDIRDRHALRRAIPINADIVFHFAAMKHIDVVEANPEEAIKTNIEGTIIAAEESIEAGVTNYVFSSTDKAVLPINTYGNTKAIAENYLLGLNGKQTNTLFRVFRWGNVLGSRGSVIPYFVKQLKNGGDLNLTHPDMTRFWIPISEAVGFMLDNYDNQDDIGEVLIPEMKACSIIRIITRLKSLLDATGKVKNVGIRPGEKIHECLYTSHDYCYRSDTAPQFTDDELDNLLRPFL